MGQAAVVGQCQPQAQGPSPTAPQRRLAKPSSPGASPVRAEPWPPRCLAFPSRSSRCRSYPRRSTHLRPARLRGAHRRSARRPRQGGRYPRSFPPSAHPTSVVPVPGRRRTRLCARRMSVAPAFGHRTSPRFHLPVSVVPVPGRRRTRSRRNRPRRRRRQSRRRTHRRGHPVSSPICHGRRRTEVPSPGRPMARHCPDPVVPVGAARSN
ncbi:MAG: hypothetical protein KatS3mg061_0022 [Dehalococcoidia bacterium]|nr:MAG: hypothetical protein KatS3mg061_0022 [Dehalococcoidia bacterium]